MELEDKRLLRNIGLASLVCQIVLFLLAVWHKKVQMRVVDQELRQEWAEHQHRR